MDLKMRSNLIGQIAMSQMERKVPDPRLVAQRNEKLSVAHQKVEALQSGAQRVLGAREHRHDVIVDVTFNAIETEQWEQAINGELRLLGWAKKWPQGCR